MRSPRLGLPALCAAVGSALALVIFLAGPPAPDAPAHLFQTWLYDHAGFQLWNNYWYAGRYEFVNYSLLYYPLAALVGHGITSAAAAGLLSASFASVARREWGPAATGPSVALAVTSTAITMGSGSYPFLAGSAAAGLALVALQRGWRVTFVVATLACLGFSPLAFALLMALLAAVALGQPRPLAALRRHRVAFAAVLAVFVAGVMLQRAFPSGGVYPYSLADAAMITFFSLAGLLITGSSPRARSLRMLFAAYLALNLIAFLLPGPIGSNTTRLFALAGAPLLWLAANVNGARSRFVVAPVLGLTLVMQIGPLLQNSYSAWGDDEAAGRDFWRPVERFLADRHDGRHRVEVVATRGHWEAYYLAKQGIPLARGWFRQDDFPHNSPLYRSELTPIAYRSWLRRMGVRFVFLPRARLDYSAVAEARLLRSGESGLTVAAQLPGWTVYELPDAVPIVTGVPRAEPRLIRLGPERVAFWAPAAGSYLVRVRHSPYWSASPSSACVDRAAGGMTLVRTEHAAYVRLDIATGLGDVADTLAPGERAAC